MAKILAVRFSALGDVAMTVPVLYSFAKACPQHQLVVLSRPAFASFFVCAPPNITFRKADLKNDYKGFKGILKLYSELRKERFDAVADLHDVLRTKVLRTLFLLGGVRVAYIDKGRAEKRRLVSAGNGNSAPLKSSFSRYRDVFRSLGYSFPLDFKSVFESCGTLPSLPETFGEKEKGWKWIGIAPFAAHQGKIYPLLLQHKVVSLLSSMDKVRIFLFGGGKQEKEVLAAWDNEFSCVTSVVGCLKMDEELALMARLDVMLSMDSGNMHLASLVGVPVVSVWGATHPYAGFMGWNQKQENAIQLDLPCRPCSVYGNKPCRFGDYRCLKAIRPEMIVGRIKALTE